MLTRLVNHNDRIPLTSSSLTRFHSRAPPSISIHDYLQRILKYASVEKICLLLLLIYIDRVCEAHPHFTVSSLTVHRFIITGICVSSKALSDSYCSNSFYAKVGGIATKELNTLELELLFLIDWTLVCNADTLQSYYVNLIKQSKGYTRESFVESDNSSELNLHSVPVKRLTLQERIDESQKTGSDFLKSTPTSSSSFSSSPFLHVPSSASGVSTSTISASASSCSTSPHSAPPVSVPYYSSQQTKSELQNQQLNSEQPLNSNSFPLPPTSAPSLTTTTPSATIITPSTSTTIPSAITTITTSTTSSHQHHHSFVDYDSNTYSSQSSSSVSPVYHHHYHHHHLPAQALTSPHGYSLSLSPPLTLPSLNSLCSTKSASSISSSLLHDLISQQSLLQPELQLESESQSKPELSTSRSQSKSKSQSQDGNDFITGLAHSHSNAVTPLESRRKQPTFSSISFDSMNHYSLISHQGPNKEDESSRFLPSLQPLTPFESPTSQKSFSPSNPIYSSESPRLQFEVSEIESPTNLKRLDSPITSILLNQSFPSSCTTVNPSLRLGRISDKPEDERR